MPRPRLAAAALFASLAAIGLVGCSAATTSTTNAATPASTSAADQPVSGDISDSTVYVAVSADSGLFSVTVPQGWAKSAANGTTVYTDKLNSVSFSQTAAKSAPTVDSVTQGLVADLKAAHPSFALTDVTTVTLPAGQAVRVRYTVDSAANTVTGKVVQDSVEAYVLFKNGQQVVLTLSGPKSADNVDPWKTVSESFTWTA